MILIYILVDQKAAKQQLKEIHNQILKKILLLDDEKLLKKSIIEKIFLIIDFIKKHENVLIKAIKNKFNNEKNKKK